MGLNDLMTEIKQDQTCFVGDEALENKVLMQVLALVEDKISEVKNQAVKWYFLWSRRFSCSCPRTQSRPIDQDYSPNPDGDGCG